MVLIIIRKKIGSLHDESRLTSHEWDVNPDEGAEEVVYCSFMGVH